MDPPQRKVSYAQSSLMFRGNSGKKAAAATAAAATVLPKAEAPPSASTPSGSGSPKPHQCRVIVAYCDGDEFALERRLLWQEVLPELQSFSFHSGFDLEWVDPLMMNSGRLTTQMAEELASQMDNPNTWLLCFLGDKYGSVGAPTEIRKAEFEAIRSAVFEQNADVKLLDQHYVLDRSREREEYRLSTSLEDSKARSRLVKVIQKGADTAFEEGVINQVSGQRQKRFQQSPIQIVADKALQLGGRSTFVMRLFEGVRHDTASNSTYTDKTEDGQKKIMSLKNEVASKMDSKFVFNHVFKPENGDISALLQSREAEKYGDAIVRQITEQLKSQLIMLTPALRPGPPLHLMDIAKDEDNVHTEFLAEQLKKPWFSRAALDARVTELLSAKEGGVYVIQGPELSGKTKFLCRLYEKAPPDAHKIIRFLNISYSSMFAHEVWQLICMILAFTNKISSQTVQKSFKLSTTMEVFEQLVERLSKPLYLFLDDMHLMKYGHFLSAVSKRFSKGPPKLFLYMTSSNISSISSMYIVTQTINIDAPTEDEIIEMLKLNVSVTDRKVSSDQLSGIKLQLSGNNCNIAVAETLLDEWLLKGNGTMHGGIEGRLERAEAHLSNLAVRSVGRYLSVSSHGLTWLELYDLLSSNHDLMDKMGGGSAFPPLLLDSIIQALGSMLVKVELDHRIVYRISHLYLLNIIRHRYFSSTVDLKMVHSEITDIFSGLLRVDEEQLSPRSAPTYQVFIQELKRESGSANIRKIRNLWYHLLHTGNMDALKELALCQFEYVDSVLKNCGIMHLLSLYEECAMQVLHHDIQILGEQVLLPALPTVVRDMEQLSAEVIGRLRFTRGENSHFLNTMVEQAMGWVDTYSRQPLLVPLTCWIPPQIMKSCRSFLLKDWNSSQTILTPSHNHQHVLITGNQSAVGVIYMYHIPSQMMVNLFKGHTAAVTALCASSNGLFFISTSADKTIKKWSFAQGECEQTWKPHSQKVTCAILNSDDSLLVTGSADSSAKVINVETGEVLRSFNEHTGSVVSLQLTSNDQFLITGSGDFVVQMWSLKDGRCISRMGGLMAPVCCVCVTTNDAFVAVGCEDETLRVYSTVSGTELHELMGHEGKVNALAAAHDDCQLFAATKSKIYCYDIHNGQILDILDCQQPFPVFSLKITSDNFFLISACGPRIHVWNINKRVHEQHDTTQDKEGFVTAITMSADEKWAACGTYNGIVAFWDLDICQCNTTVIQAKGVPVSCLTFTSNSMLLLSGNAIGNISILESSSGNVIREVNLHSAEIISIAYMDCQRVYSCCKEGKLCTWSLFEDEDSTDTVSQGIVPPIFAPPHGRIMIAHCPNNAKEMKVYGYTEQGFVQKNKLYHNEEITCFAASTNGALVATGSTDQSLKLWQIESGYLTQVLVGHEDAVTCIAMAEDERIVVSGAKDRKMIIWNVATGDIAHSLSTSGPVTAVALTADATVAFSGLEDGWIEAWSTDKGKLTSSFNAHRPIRNIAQSFDANRLLVHLTGCAQLPILCLHNSPAGPIVVNQRKRSARTQSITSLGNSDNATSSGSEPKKDLLTASVPSGNGSTRGGNPRPTFDKLERSKSRTSLIEKDRATTITTVTTPTTKSNMCTLL